MRCRQHFKNGVYGSCLTKKINYQFYGLLKQFSIKAERADFLPLVLLFSFCIFFYKLGYTCFKEKISFFLFHKYFKPFSQSLNKSDTNAERIKTPKTRNRKKRIPLFIHNVPLNFQKRPLV